MGILYPPLDPEYLDSLPAGTILAAAGNFDDGCREVYVAGDSEDTWFAAGSSEVLRTHRLTDFSGGPFVVYLPN